MSESVNITVKTEPIMEAEPLDVKPEVMMSTEPMRLESVKVEDPESGLKTEVNEELVVKLGENEKGYVVGFKNFFKGDKLKIRQLAHTILKPEEIVEIFVAGVNKVTFSFIKVSTLSACEKLINQTKSIVIEGNLVQVEKYDVVDLKKILLPFSNDLKKEKKFLVCVFMNGVARSMVEQKFREIVENVLCSEINDAFLIKSNKGSNTYNFGFLKTTSKEIFKKATAFLKSFNGLFTDKKGSVCIKEGEIINAKEKPDVLLNLDSNLTPSEIKNLWPRKRKLKDEDLISAEEPTSKQIKIEEVAENKDEELISAEEPTSKQIKIEEVAENNGKNYVVAFQNFFKGNEAEGLGSIVYALLNPEEIVDLFVFKKARKINYSFVRVSSIEALEKLLKLRIWSVQKGAVRGRQFEFIDMKPTSSWSNVKNEEEFLVCMAFEQFAKGTEEENFRKYIPSDIIPVDLFLINGDDKSFGFLKVASKQILEKILLLNGEVIQGKSIIKMQEVKILNSKKTQESNNLKLLPPDCGAQGLNINIAEKSTFMQWSRYGFRVEYDAGIRNDDLYPVTLRYIAFVLRSGKALSDEEFKSFMESIVPSEGILRIMRSRRKRSALVDFADEESLQKAVLSNGMKYQDQVVKIQALKEA